MLNHVVVGTNDLEAARSFYDAVFAALDVGAGVLDDNRRYLYANSSGLFVVGKPIDGAPAASSNGYTIGFAAPSPAHVNAWHAAGVSHGGTSCEDPPGLRETDLGSLYAAYLRDPDGHKLCAVARIEA